MTTLLPRLDPRSATKLRSSYLTVANGPAFSQSALEELLQHRSAFPATGGLRITFAQLMEFRNRCCKSLDSSDRTANFEVSFDLNIGTLLRELGKSSRSDMGVAAVWDFLTLVLLPDLVARRLGDLSSESSGLRSRITGGDRRHQLQRLWKRRVALGDELVDARLLTEDDYLQLLERNITLERGELTRRIARAIISSGFSGEKRREYTRTMMKSLMQMSGLVHFDETDIKHLDAAVEELHRWTMAKLDHSATPDIFNAPTAETIGSRTRPLASKRQ